MKTSNTINLLKQVPRQFLGNSKFLSILRKIYAYDKKNLRDIGRGNHRNREDSMNCFKNIFIKYKGTLCSF